MKTLVITAATLVGWTLAVPAAAQSEGDHMAQRPGTGKR